MRSSFQRDFPAESAVTYDRVNTPPLVHGLTLMRIKGSGNSFKRAIGLDEGSGDITWKQPLFLLVSAMKMA